MSKTELCSFTNKRTIKKLKLHIPNGLLMYSNLALYSKCLFCYVTCLLVKLVIRLSAILCHHNPRGSTFINLRPETYCHMYVPVKFPVFPYLVIIRFLLSWFDYSWNLFAVSGSLPSAALCHQRLSQGHLLWGSPARVRIESKPAKRWEIQATGSLKASLNNCFNFDKRDYNIL